MMFVDVHRHGHRVLNCPVRDISPDGVFVVTGRGPFAVGSILELVFRRGQERLVVQAMVRRCSGTGLRVQFITSNLRLMRRLRSLLFQSRADTSMHEHQARGSGVSETCS